MNNRVTIFTALFVAGVLFYFVRGRLGSIDVSDVNSASGISSSLSRLSDRETQRRKSIRPVDVNLIETNLLQDLEKFSEDYQPQFSSSARAFFHVDPAANFWLDVLKSPNDEEQKIAIQVFEKVVDPEFDMENRDRGLVPDMAFRIRTTTEIARRQVANIRMVLAQNISEGEYPADIEFKDLVALTSGDKTDGRTYFSNHRGNGDLDVVKDVEILVETFVPRLIDEDPLASEVALGVLNYFTYDYFEDMDEDFWIDLSGSTNDLKSFFDRKLTE